MMIERGISFEVPCSFLVGLLQIHESCCWMNKNPWWFCWWNSVKNPISGRFCLHFSIRSVWWFSPKKTSAFPAPRSLSIHPLLQRLVVCCEWAPLPLSGSGGMDHGAMNHAGCVPANFNGTPMDFRNTDTWTSIGVPLTMICTSQVIVPCFFSMVICDHSRLDLSE